VAPDPFAPTLADLRARRGRKWARFGPDVLPAWVADMDYGVAPIVAASLRQAVDAGDLGYPPEQLDAVAAAYANRVADRYGWEPDPELILVYPDVMAGIEHTLVQCTRPGDGVLVTTPVYPRFFRVITLAGRRVVGVPLTPGHRLDGDALAATMARERPTALLISHPHNPTGRVFDHDELTALGRAAVEHDAIVVSDEIHAELTYPGHEHRPLALLGPEVARRTVTVTSASKAFNLAGLRCAVAVCGDGAVHARLAATAGYGYEAVGALGVLATLAAWTPEGEAWLADCLAALEVNRDHLAARLAAELPAVGFVPPEATYLAWLDCRALDLGPRPAQWFLEQARVALAAGEDFGPPGAGFCRLNFATAPAVLDAVVDRLVTAIETR
jgi:cystathionine beta-lyase